MSLTDESIVLESMEGCARCGFTHHAMRLFKLGRPMHVSGETFTHWALCPSRREPIMFSEQAQSRIRPIE